MAFWSSVLAAFASVLLVGVGPATARTASGERVRFSHLGVEDGLSNAWVQSILKDSRGFLWFGTQDGLNRYDGAGIKVYRHDPRDPDSLPSAAASVLFEDHAKRLWVGSGWGNRGVARFDRDREAFETFLPDVRERGANNVYTIVEDAQQRLWLGTNNGLARLDPESGVIRRFPLVPDERLGEVTAVVTTLHNRDRHRLWVGTMAGLLSFDAESGRYSRPSWSGPRQDALSKTEIGALYQEADGGLWIGTLGAGLYRADTRTGRVTSYRPDPRRPWTIGHARVRRLLPDRDGGLWVGTENGGLDRLDLRSRRFTHFRSAPTDPEGLNCGSIWSLYLDDQGILWIGTYNGGANIVSPFAQRFATLTARPGGLSDPHVSAVMEDHLGNLWVGTDGGGLNRIDARTGRSTAFRHDPDDPGTLGSDAVWGLLEDGRGDIWVGGWDGGLDLLDRRSGRFTVFRHDPRDPRSIASDHVWRVLELPGGELLVVTQAGADLFDRRGRVFSRLADRFPGANPGVLYGAATDGKSHLWLAGMGEVQEIDLATGQITTYSNPPGNPANVGVGWTQALLADSAGQVWAGTDSGLRCISPQTRQVRLFTTSDGLPANAINSLVEDSRGNLWVGTDHGIGELIGAVRLPAKPEFRVFDRWDGLPGDAFARNAAFRTRDGRIFFGGSGGLVSFDPAHLPRNSQAPPVVLTDLRVLNHPVTIGPGSRLDRAVSEASTLTLSYRDTMVTFGFAALDFVAPHKNRYAYKLEGFDRDWNEVGTDHFATYTNLPAGQFVFRVRASNGEGVWNEEGAALAVTVTPPFWKTWPFSATMAGLALGAVWAAHRSRVRRHIRVERMLTARVAEALAQVKTLRGLLPVCAWCKKVRDDRGYWNRIEEYVRQHTDAEVSHGICPDCAVSLSAGAEPPREVAAATKSREA